MPSIALVNKSTKASASKKQAAGGAARGAARASNKAPGGGKRGGKKAVEVEEEEDGDEDDETTGDEVIQETQEDEMEMEVDASNKGRGKKRAAPAEKGKGPATTKGHNASGVKEDDEETAVTPREKRLQAKLDSVRSRRRSDPVDGELTLFSMGILHRFRQPSLELKPLLNNFASSARQERRSRRRSSPTSPLDGLPVRPVFLSIYLNPTQLCFLQTRSRPSSPTSLRTNPSAPKSPISPPVSLRGPGPTLQ